MKSVEHLVDDHLRSTFITELVNLYNTCNLFRFYCLFDLDHYIRNDLLLYLLVFNFDKLIEHNLEHLLLKKDLVKLKQTLKGLLTNIRGTKS